MNLYVNPIFPRWSMGKWLEASQPHVQTRLREYAIELLKDLSASEDHEELMGKGRSLLGREINR